MLPDDLQTWDDAFRRKAREIYPPADPSHDILHVERVVRMALRLAREEGADMHVVLPAAWFHDFVTIAKNDPRRAQASRLSAEAAVAWLGSAGYPAQYMEAVFHAISAHSFSAGIPAETLEAKVVQDADRLDGLGAIGIARCFTTSALMGVSYYCPEDMLAERRALDDKRHTVDHFFTKLFRTVDMLQTAAAQAEGRRRAEFMRQYLGMLQAEVGAYAA